MILKSSGMIGKPIDKEVIVKIVTSSNGSDSQVIHDWDTGEMPLFQNLIGLTIKNFTIEPESIFNSIEGDKFIVLELERRTS